MTRTIDLNADLGEGCPWDEALLDRVTSASVCCGAHAGDPATSLQTLRWAAGRGVVVGAHPGYADRERFGRRDQDLPGDDLEALVEGQLQNLERLAGQLDMPIRFVKPHGALYNQAQGDREIAARLLDPVARRGLPVLGQPGGQVEAIAIGRGLPFIAEGFADRRYRADGRLVPRTEPGAILEDPAEIRAQILSLVERGFATICLHGDNPRSVELADLVLATLKDAGVELKGFA